LIGELIITGDSPTIAAARKELQTGLSGLLGQTVMVSKEPGQAQVLVAGTPASSALIKNAGIADRLKPLGDEGYLLLTTQQNGRSYTYIAANTDIGVLYGSFHFLRLLQTNQDISKL